MNKKNIVLLVVMAFLLLLYWNTYLLKEKRAFAAQTEGMYQHQVKEAVERLEPFYDQELSYWVANLPQDSGKDLLQIRINELRDTKSFFDSLYLSDVSLLSKPYETMVLLLEELLETGSLNEKKKEELHEAVLTARTLVGRIITYAQESKKGWYYELTDVESKSSRLVREELGESEE